MTEVFDDHEFKNDLQLRLFQFAVQAILLLRCLPKGKEYDVIGWQFLKSSSSCGANYEEAQGAVSKADFSNKIAIVLKEIRESNYWIKLIIAVTDKSNEWNKLRKEAFELKNIIGSIHVKTSMKRKFN
ncbi:MAG: four helix bundle protein [Prolixibacteraceae bacterium]|nr:four helix bundle protein [Prolixibacteraceae bacterium]